MRAGEISEGDQGEVRTPRSLREIRDGAALVTGGAGFIGSHLTDELIAHGARVTVLDSLTTGRLDNLAHLLSSSERHALAERAAGTAPVVCMSSVAPLTVVLGDIREIAHCRLAAGLEPVSRVAFARADGGGTSVFRLQAPEFIFHQAALGSVPRSMADPATTIAVNVAGTANVLAAARDAGVRRVVYASSSGVYGDSATLPKREGEEGLPLSPYALSKVLTEELAALFAVCYRMELIGLRYFNVFGPRQDPEGPYAAVIPRFFAAFLAGEPPVVFGDGEQSRDFTYVADAVAANLLAAVAPLESCGRAYNVAPGARTTVRELARLVRAVVGGGPEPVHIEPRPGDVRHSQACVSRAREALGFTAEVTLRDGLQRATAYYAGMVERRGEDVIAAP